MTIPEFFKAFPFIKITTFAREIGVDPGAFNRYVQEYTDPPEWVVDKFKSKLIELSTVFGATSIMIHYTQKQNQNVSKNPTIRSANAND